ncbi:MAG: ABC transporter ATP-binding protein/permease [Anaerolineales bacterium]|jgi:ATP-binding cassette subfamily B protein/subfamily B ATP-binding cassette protein MsbA|nr:ABC transporter ATP-binding protein/permease [Anaerolineales bacterium]
MAQAAPAKTNAAQAQKPASPHEDEIQLKGYDPELTRRLWGFASVYRWQLLVAVILMLTASLGATAGPYLVSIAIDRGLAVGSRQVLYQAVALYIGAVLLQWASMVIRINIMARVGQRVVMDLRARLFDHLQGLSLSFFSRYSVGRVITRVVNDVEVLREFLTWAMLAIARDVFTLVFILAAMVALNPRLSLLAFTVMPLMWIITVTFRKRARENYRKVRSAISWVNSVLAENINGVRVVQAFARETVNFERFRGEVNQNHLTTSIKAARIAAAYPSAIDFLGSLSVALVVWLGGRAVLGDSFLGIGEVTPGILIAFVLYIERFFEPIRDLSQRYDSFQSTMAASERIFGLLDTEPEVQDLPGAADLPDLRGEVKFENVSFHYSDDETLVLKDINLDVQAGQTVALVGETGAGKSTLVKLISRFVDPTVGRVTVDSMDLRQVTQQSLRRQMGIVLQDPFLFNGTVLENIRFGRLQASEAEVEGVARAVGAHEFIMHLPHGYATNVQEGGIILSVGQRQLISFARALLADPRILILDEATSSVDTQTERLIQQALARLLKGRTAFVIAHRLSTVVNADRIMVIEGGEISEQGTHAELLALGGAYFQLYTSGFEE